ncbi:anti-sigma-V factor rsiV [Psychrobacillus vulpis]|uniref:Anti-sigma-V factor rsiV n=1 Tax=Psychrobacillus vulpis TaxID=2325572 RepID=A0A544TVU4_9BACI|nr:anti-sigma-V factor rsiV [Psychrobacillus vulpis]TQR21544.1 anti-sigma-V factor rsiV [Psychrobacillus vulpis]
MKRLKNAKKQYDDIEIPSELQSVVEKSIQEARRKHIKNAPFKKWGIGVAAAASLFIASVNVSPALAQSLSSVPVLGSIVQVVTIQEIKIAEDSYNADLKIPSVTGLDNKELENRLNEKYTAENKALYEDFQKDMEALKEAGGGHLGVASTYEVVTDTEDILSISRYEVNTVGSSSTTMRTDTIDKKNQILITLPSLFKDDAYIEAISTYLKDEMAKQMANDSDKTYWIDDKEEIGFEFEAIRPDQTFSITADHKLTISFDKYEVAPGYMGVVTFEIPTEVIAEHLISNYYIK